MPGKSFGQKLWEAILEGSRMSRDARIGAVGAEPIRQLYSEGKTEEAQQRAKELAKANIAGIAIGVGAANTAGLVGDMAITAATTAADTVVEGNTDNLKKDLANNLLFDIAGKGAGDVIGYVAKEVSPYVLRILPEPVVKFLNKADVSKSTQPERTTRLYRAQGTNGKFEPSIDGTAQYAGM
jgi:hypothetical protein